MPGLNRTGPQGQGPMTGGARGNCNRANMQTTEPMSEPMGFGRGMAYGRGRNFRGNYGNGMGMRQGYGRDVGTSDDDLNMLKAEIELLNKRIAELENR